MYWDNSHEQNFKNYATVKPHQKEKYFTQHIYPALENLSTGLIRKHWMKLQLFKFQNLKEELITHFYLIIKDDKIDFDKGKAYSYLTKAGYHKLLAMKMKLDNANNKNEYVYIDEQVYQTNDLLYEIQDAYDSTQEYDSHDELDNLQNFLDICIETPMNIIKLTSKKMNSSTILLQKQILTCLLYLLKDNVLLLNEVTFLGELYDIVSETTGITNKNQIRQTVLKLRIGYTLYNEQLNQNGQTHEYI